MKSNFQATAESKHIKEKTINILSEQDIDSTETLKDIHSNDLIELCDITIGQRRILLNWIKELHDMDQHMDETVSNFQAVAKSKNVKEKTLHILSDQDIDSVETLKVIEDDDLDKMCQITIGQRRLLLNWIKDLNDKNMFGTIQGDSSIDRTCNVDVGSAFTCPDETDSYDDESELIDQLEVGVQLSDDIKQEVEKHGVDGLGELIRNRLHIYQEAKINIAVVGESGTGKSSLINNLRNMQAQDKGAAEVGVTECSKKISSYSYPNLPNVLLWDLPGVNTPNFPKDTYMGDVKFTQYDALIICISTRFTYNDLWLSRKAVENKIPFFLVRTKIDVDIENDKRDRHANDNGEDLLQTIQNDMFEQVRTFDLTPQPKLYLVSNRLNHQARWDFPNLQRDLLENTPEKNKGPIILALVSSSPEIIENKRRELDKRIDKTALLAAASPDECESLWQKEMMMYRQCFGLNRSSFLKWNIKPESMHGALRKNFAKMRKLEELLESKEKHMEHVMGEKKPSVFGQQYFSIFGSSAAKYIDSKVDKWNQYRQKRQMTKAKCGKQRIVSKRNKTKTELKIQIIEATKEVLSDALGMYYELAQGVLKERVNDVQGISV